MEENIELLLQAGPIVIPTSIPRCLCSLWAGLGSTTCWPTCSSTPLELRNTGGWLGGAIVPRFVYFIIPCLCKDIVRDYIISKQLESMHVLLFAVDNVHSNEMDFTWVVFTTAWLIRTDTLIMGISVHQNDHVTLWKTIQMGVCVCIVSMCFCLLCLDILSKCLRELGWDNVWCWPTVEKGDICWPTSITQWPWDKNTLKLNNVS